MLIYEKKFDDVVTRYGFSIKKKQYGHIDDLYVHTLFRSVNGRYDICIRVESEETSIAFYDNEQERIVGRLFDNHVGKICNWLRLRIRNELDNQIYELEEQI